MHSKSLLLLPILLAISAGCATVNSPPSNQGIESWIGQTVPPEAPPVDTDNYHPPVVGLLPDHSVHAITHDGEEYIVSADREGLIWYVATASPAFRSRVGIGPGSPVVSAIGVSAGPMELDGDWTYVQLQDGWWATFSRRTLENEREGATIQWMFFRDGE